MSNCGSGDFGLSVWNTRTTEQTETSPLSPLHGPYVKAVGSTQFVGQAETDAWFPRDGDTGGEFSEHFSVPGYQANDTSIYVHTIIICLFL